MGKRAATGMSPAAKKQHGPDLEAVRCRKVAAAVACLEALPEAVRDMLQLVLPALQVPPPRHPYQEGVASMVGDALDAEERRLEALVKAGQAAVDAAAVEKEQRQEAVHRADYAVNEHSEELQRKKVALAEHARAFQAAKAAVARAESARLEHEEALSVSALQKAALESAAGDLVKPLVEGSLPADEVPTTMQRLLDVLQGQQLDEGMVAALPNALGKEPSKRGSFDTAVVHKLHEHVDEQLAGLDARLKAGEPARAERQHALESAQDTLRHAREAQQVSAAVFLAAREHHQKLEEDLAAAHEALRQQGAEIKRHQRELGGAQRRLDAFAKGPKAAFQELRDGPKPATPEEPSALEEGQAAAAAVPASQEAAATVPASQEAVAVVPEAPVGVSSD